MSINNLHSILTGKFFIHEAYGKSLLPSLHLLLQGKLETPEVKEASLVSYISASTGKPISADVIFSNNSQDDYVSIVNIKSPIYKYSQSCGPQGTKAIMSRLERLKNEEGCIGVVLDIDSGGGQVSGTPEFHDYITNYTKPIVAYTDGMMCSAAYYIGSATDTIIANKRADYIGSIGTMISFIDMTGYYEKKGAKVITEYATKSTRKNRNYEDLISGNSENYIKNDLDPINETFHADIKKVRPNVSNDVFTGETWNAENALEKGLVDQLGTLNDAINKVVALSNSNKSKTQNNMSKQRAKVQAVLGLDAPLAKTDNGSYLNDQQLDALDAHMEQQDSATADLQSQLDAAQNNTDLNDQLDVANATITGVETSIDAMLTQSGLDVTGTLDEKLDALNAKVTEMSKADGDTHTKVKTKAKTKEEANAFNIDANASHNQIANQIHNN